MKILFVATAALVLAACAAPTTTKDDPAEEKSYRTGSHVPVRDRNQGSSSVTTSAAPAAGTPAPYVPGKGGGQ
jgi:uncharacterized lipoprotein YajG